MASSASAAGRAGGIYQGWWVLSATFVCAMVIIGSTNYAFQLFVIPLEQEFGLSRAAVNQGVSLLMLGTMLWAPLAGRALDRWPAPWVMGAGGLSIALGMWTIAWTSSLALMAAAIVGPISLGAMTAGGLANTTVVSRWFRRRRGTALGIATVSSGAGGFVMVQLLTFVIERHGWRVALATAGASIAVVVGLAVLWVIRSRPAEGQLERAGELAGGLAAPPAHEDGWPLRKLVRTRMFWLIAAGTGLLLASDGALLASKIPYLLALGIEPQAASFLVACQTVSAVVGKIAIGLAADRVDLRRLFGAVALCHVLLLAVLIAEPGYWVLLAALSLFGVGLGGVYPLQAALAASTFGSASFGSVMGTMSFLYHPVAIAAVTFIGAAHDRTGSYALAFWVFIGLVFVSAALIAGVRRPLPAARLAAPLAEAP